MTQIIQFLSIFQQLLQINSKKQNKYAWIHIVITNSLMIKVIIYAFYEFHIKLET